MPDLFSLMEDYSACWHDLFACLQVLSA